jgi:hypothetical protein
MSLPSQLGAFCPQAPVSDREASALGSPEEVAHTLATLARAEALVACGQGQEARKDEVRGGVEVDRADV